MINFNEEKWISFTEGNAKYSLSISGKLYSHRYNKLMKPQNLIKQGTRQLYYTLKISGKMKWIPISKLVMTMFKLPVLPQENVVQWDGNYNHNHISNLETIYIGDQIRLAAIKRSKFSHIDKPRKYSPSGPEYYRVNIRTKEGLDVAKYFRTKKEAALFRDNYFAKNFKHLLKY